jgi:hypothetical protein
MIIVKKAKTPARDPKSDKSFQIEYVYVDGQ